uniref:Ubiquitin-like protease family profile domain-containing protein n=1 Tax=Cajanus cajan TaxID=3821 RepID=A0A151UHP8_CAJCA
MRCVECECDVIVVPHTYDQGWHDLGYMDKLSVEQAQAQVYGFIELQSIQKSGNTQVQIQQYMQTWMSDSRRDIYMAPYIDGSHWQLMVIIPKEYTMVWFCSLHRKPSHEIKFQLQGIVSGANILSGRSRSSKALHFIYPKCNKQQDSFECGYYIMYRMIAIVSTGITNSWAQVFQDPSPLPEDEIIKIREQWATFFLQSI